MPAFRFGALHCFFAIAHDRRRIFHRNVTEHASNAWIIWQLQETIPCDLLTGYLIIDRGASSNEMAVG